MPLQIIRNDITKVRADAIVNTANPMVAVGAGVDQTIYEAAGWDELFEQRTAIGPMEPGQAAATDAFALDAKYIIHTVGPAWQGGNHGEREAVASCYRESLRIADELGCESVAFPLIATGTYRFPKDEALNIAVSEISSFLFTHDLTVYMVVYDPESFVLSGKAFADIKSYIEEKDVMDVGTPAFGSSYAAASRKRPLAARKKIREKEFISEEAFIPDEMFSVDMDADMPDSLLCDLEPKEQIKLPRCEETFQELLFRHIDRKGMEDPEVYKKANLDRKLFSKIRSNKNYMPSKKTALALAVALELNMDETLDLLRRAGLTLSPSIRFDLIVSYCIEHKIYNIFDINMYLFVFGEPILA